MTTTQIKQLQFAAPTAASVAAVAGGGTFAAATYFWKVTATGPGNIESIPSSEVTVAVALNGHADVTFTPPATATGFKLYRGPTGAEDHVVYAGGCAGGVANTFTDTGVTGTVATLPTTQALGTVTKNVTIPAKSNLTATPAIGVGAQLGLYEGMSEWLSDAASATSVPTTSSAALRGKKMCAAAGFLIQET